MQQKEEADWEKQEAAQEWKHVGGDTWFERWREELQQDPPPPTGKQATSMSHTSQARAERPENTNYINIE